EETPALARFRTDLPAHARSALGSLRGGNGHAKTDERHGVQRLWDACARAAGRSAPPPPAAGEAPVRHRDYIRAIYGLDTDAWIHPSLIRFLASYLDQGLAHWTMPDRALGIHGCFLEIYRSQLAAQCGKWARTLPRVVLDDHAADRDALTSIEHSLAVLGVEAREWMDFLRAELLALPGWAGIIRQIEERPDRVPARDLTVTLRGYLAVRLLFERAALEEAAREIGFAGRVSELRSMLHERLPSPAPPTQLERAWPLFHVGQLCGLDGSIVERW